jgi:tetratricopeptide (TPR) repeat protein
MGESGTRQITSARNSFVGRERELGELLSACESGAESDVHLFLIYGEPGIGKTRLADELASRAKARGMQVLWGRCWEGDGAPTYWPWIQIIRTFLGTLDPERRRLALESEVTRDFSYEVAQIVPDLRSAQSSLPSPGSERLDPNEARFRLFDAVTNFLKIGARSEPMLVVFDDLHDADEASLALLRFMARELKGAPILIVATYRDLEVRRSPALSKVVGELSREAHSIPLGSLSRSEVSQFVEIMMGRAPDEALVAKLWATTNGNPLFVDGVVRTLIAEGAMGSAGDVDRQFRIPGGVREAIRTRLVTLSAEANSILTWAAAIGNEFELNLCRSAANASADEANRLLDEAAGAGIVRPLGEGHYRFCHALIRDSVYDELDTSSRIATHRKIGERMEDLYRADIDAHLAELAHHFREAGLAEKAIDYSVRAGKASASVFAYTDAVTHLQAAAELMELQDPDLLRRADLLSFIGSIAFWVDRATSLKYWESAGALYEKLGCFDQAGMVYVQLGVIFHMRGEPQTNASRATDYLRRAELAIPKEPETIHVAGLYTVIAQNEFAKLNFTQAATAAKHAVQICERLGIERNWPKLAATAEYGESLCMKGQLSEGLALLDRTFESALQAKVSGYESAWRHGYICILLGDPHGAQLWWERELTRLKKDASPLAFHFFSGWIDIARFDEGHLVDMEKKYSPDPRATTFGSTRRAWLAGQWEDAAEVLEREVARCDRADNQLYSLSQCLFAGLTNLLVGQHARAEALFRYGLDDTDQEAKVLLEMRSRPWLAQLYVETGRLHAAAEQVARCHQIMAAGEDWRGLAGDAARAEGVVAAAQGDYELAFRKFESALAVHQKYRLAWDEAHTLQYWGRALAAAGDRAGAAEKFDACIELNLARGVGPRFLDYVRADKERALGSSPTRADLGANRQTGSAKPALSGTFRKEGEFWTIAFADRTFRLKDAKGLHYIAYLVARPGQRIHVLDLIDAIEGSAAGGRISNQVESEGLSVIRDLGGSGAPIDARARSEYRARLGDLEADLDEAERMNDLGHIERLRAEIEAVERELTESSGLGARRRARSAHAERARGLVRKNIRTALDKIRHENQALGRHFSRAISLGYFCAYQSEDPVSWQF